MERCYKVILSKIFIRKRLKEFNLSLKNVKKVIWDLTYLKIIFSNKQI